MPGRRQQTAYGSGSADVGLGMREDSPGFYAALREKLFGMLGGKICSGCGFKDPRALGIASRYGGMQFDSICRGGAIASSWYKYSADPDMAASELVVLCLNCNRIREPLSRPDADEQGRGKDNPPKTKRTFPR